MSTGKDSVPPATLPRITSISSLGRLVYLAWRRGRVDQMSLMAAGVAFYAFLALFPALVAFEFLYALFADPATVATDVKALTSVMPQAARDVLSMQLITLVGQPRPVLGVGLVVAVLLEFWSASSLINSMMGAVNTAYHLPESRGIVRRRLLAFLMTLGTIAFMVGVCVLVAIAPRVIYDLVGDGWARWALEVVRWALLLALVSVALPVVYRVSPPVAPRKTSWYSTGAVVAAGLWLIASAGFTLYAATLGDYAQSFGVFGGVVVLVLWLWITVYAVLIGAEVNALRSETWELQQNSSESESAAPEQSLDSGRDPRKHQPQVVMPSPRRRGATSEPQPGNRPRRHTNPR